jgi:hypothetical protein
VWQCSIPRSGYDRDIQKSLPAQNEKVQYHHLAVKYF